MPKVHVIPEVGADFSAEIANLTPNSVFIKTVQAFHFRDKVTIEMFELSVDGEVTFITHNPPGVIVVFSADLDTRLRLDEHAKGIEVLTYEVEPEMAPKEQATILDEDGEPSNPSVPQTAPMGNPPLEPLAEDDPFSGGVSDTETLSEALERAPNTEEIHRDLSSPAGTPILKEIDHKLAKMRKATVSERPGEPRPTPPSARREVDLIKSRIAIELRPGEAPTELDALALEKEEEDEPFAEDTFIPGDTKEDGE